MNIYLAQHYNGGKILEEVFSSPVDGSEANFDFKSIVWEGSYKLWPQALADPASYVDWIIVNPTDPSDLIAQQVHLQSPQFQAQFTLVLQEPSGWHLYHNSCLEFASCGQINQCGTETALPDLGRPLWLHNHYLNDVPSHPDGDLSF